MSHVLRDGNRDANVQANMAFDLQKGEIKWFNNQSNGQGVGDG